MEHTPPAAPGSIQFNDVAFAYPASNADAPALIFEDLNLSLPPGSCTLFCGPSGSGKSTALRMLNALIPQLQPGHMSGSVHMSGTDLDSIELTQVGRLSATVFQNPRTQFFTGQVLAELAYAGENYRVDRKELFDRCMDAAHTCGIEGLLDRSLHTLSGGQLQRVAQATALAAHVPVLLFDEPTANLSPEAIEEFADLLAERKAAGTTMVIAEHRLYFLKDLVDHVVYFNQGATPTVMTGAEFFHMSDEQRRTLGLRALDVPTLDTLFNADPHAQTTPLNDAAGDAASIDDAAGDSAGSDVSGGDVPGGVRLDNLTFSYGNTPILNIGELEFPAGKITALVGRNGAGKSTLAKLLCGLHSPDSGQISIGGKPTRPSALVTQAAIVMQDVHRQLFSDSVAGEVTLGAEADIDPLPLLQALHLDNYAQRHPLSLSGGQKQRLVIAAALATKRHLLIFDEPTSGVDYQHLQAISTLFRNLADDGHTVVVITHDQELIDACADRVVQLHPLSDQGAQDRQNPQDPQQTQTTIYESRIK